MEEADVLDQTIYLVRHGSHAYGTNTPDSDVDEKGVCVLRDPKFYIGFSKFDQKDGGWSDDADRQIYDIRKFVRLALACNPNIIEILFVTEDDVLKITPAGQLLRDNREMFLSRRAAKTFTGYALSQLKKVKNHKKWIDNPPSEPNPAEHVHMHALMAGDRWTREFDDHKFTVEVSSTLREISPVSITHIDKKAMSGEQKKWDQYAEWKTNRNPVRAGMEKAYGFDGKHASHLIRLLRMGEEILRDGVVKVRRPDASNLLAIRAGDFSYDDLLADAEATLERIDKLVKSSPLPADPDYDGAEELVMALITDVISFGNNSVSIGDEVINDCKADGEEEICEEDHGDMP